MKFSLLSLFCPTYGITITSTFANIRINWQLRRKPRPVEVSLDSKVNYAATVYQRRTFSVWTWSLPPMKTLHITACVTSLSLTPQNFFFLGQYFDWIDSLTACWVYTFQIFMKTLLLVCVCIPSVDITPSSQVHLLCCSTGEMGFDVRCFYCWFYR